jgi:hypothetical protein
MCEKYIYSLPYEVYCFKKLAILSLREVAVLLRNRADQIGIGDKETRKHNKQY